MQTVVNLCFLINIGQPFRSDTASNIPFGEILGRWQQLKISTLQDSTLTHKTHTSMNEQTDLLDDDLVKLNRTRRLKLLPLWIKIFCWIFIIFGCIAPVGFIYGLLGNDFDLSLYGFETSDPISLFGIGILVLFLLKGIVAFGLLKEKTWAIKLGFIDAIVGILACVLAMAYPLIGRGNFSFRLELILLIPYLIKLDKIKADWEAV